MTLDANQSDSPKNVYFLGAGFSALAGVPTFSKFRDKVNEIRYEIEPDCEPDNYQIHVPKEDEIFMKVVDHWRRYYNEYNIEQFYTAVDMSGVFKIFNKNSVADSKIKRLTNDLIELEKEIKRKQNELKKTIIFAILILILSLLLLFLLFER